MRTTLITLAALAALSMPALAQETRTITDDLGRTVDVPVDPERIAVLHDKNLGTPLIELGVLPVGSHGRTTTEGEPFIRGSITVTGFDFDNSNISFLGTNPADIEAVAEVSPDLIITSTWQNASVDRLSAIAPTVVVDTTERQTLGVFPLLAEATGTTERLARLETRYQAQIDQIQRLVNTGDIRVNVIQGINDGIYVQHTYSALGTVLRDAGFKFPPAVDAIGVGGAQTFSAEAMPELDADVIFLTYRTDQDQTPADARAAMERLFPGWCETLHACREDQMVILPRAEATSASYDALMSLALVVLAATSSTDIVSIPE
ncbi:iron complex transport system substrate-binding protein [Roseivivax halotolerans]|uniref:Iron complex transport system substrate-binding protein n=1 Tax=Roseivivax halotolerans TaxID=93684 RepID=A0A1I6A6G8_9RHOB|nr:ABC transporter substrate-binding protein [Roseivivax halotolerans]SFQ64248.1 iron complex transport system substrate-binding protein [Roseivivax halotolerans]